MAFSRYRLFVKIRCQSSQLQTLEQVLCFDENLDYGVEMGKVAGLEAAEV